MSLFPIVHELLYYSSEGKLDLADLFYIYRGLDKSISQESYCFKSHESLTEYLLLLVRASKFLLFDITPGQPEANILSADTSIQNHFILSLDYEVTEQNILVFTIDNFKVSIHETNLPDTLLPSVSVEVNKSEILSSGSIYLIANFYLIVLEASYEIVIKVIDSEQITESLLMFNRGNTSCIKIGRNENSDIVLKSNSVSRVQGEIVLKNDNWEIKNGSSVNGIFKCIYRVETLNRNQCSDSFSLYNNCKIRHGTRIYKTVFNDHGI